MLRDCCFRRARRTTCWPERFSETNSSASPSGAHYPNCVHPYRKAAGGFKDGSSRCLLLRTARRRGPSDSHLPVRRVSVQTADDRKRGRMCSRRARNRAREFRDQALCAIEAREGRGSAPQTAHSTAFSVISDSARPRPVFGRTRSLCEEVSRSVKKPLMQPDGKRIGSKGCAR